MTFSPLFLWAAALLFLTSPLHSQELRHDNEQEHDDPLLKENTTHPFYFPPPTFVEGVLDGLIPLPKGPAPVEKSPTFKPKAVMKVPENLNGVYVGASLAGQVR